MDSRATSALSSNGFHDGRASGVPKVIPKPVKARAVALLCDGESASSAKLVIEREFPEQRISVSLIARWARALKIKLRAGRPPENRPLPSPHRAAARRLRASGMSQADIARTIGISRQLVHALLKR